jgi:asparagine synthase (glutamine-hydrolysing)
MCGIAGLIDRSGDVARRARAMADALAHRGPDGADVWSDADAGIALSHRRLAIVDLTSTGAQPMTSSDGRWVVTYNGEVYNAEAIAAGPQMAGFVRRGTSDTEIIVESVARRGLDRTLADLNGMFAIALWDRQTRTLYLVRDRLGIKPLFYSQAKDRFYFASELKALVAAGLAVDLDEASAASFLRFGYVPAPHSIYRNVAKVEPGEVVSFTASGGLKRTKYWDLEKIAQNGLEHPFTGPDTQAEEILHDLLADAVSINMISDVPLGAFLSGGIDSSTVTALMVAAKRGPVQTFSIGFPDFGYDESPHAKAVADHLGTRHQELVVTANDALAVVPQFADMYDEPFADSSQIPTHVISRMTRAHVTVALSGDGGDEVFAGYNRHAMAADWLPRLQAFPLSLRRIASTVLRSIPSGAVDRLSRLLPQSMRVSQPGDKLNKLAEIMPFDGEAAYLHLVSQCHDPERLTGGRREKPLGMRGLGRSTGLFERMQLWDMATYLPDDILQKVDRASMAVSLEVRPPLLDHRVVEFAWTLPRNLRVRNGETKWLLRRVLDRYVPRNLVSRPKAGFAIPLAAWLRGPLRDWAEELVDSRQLAGGILDVAAVRKLWADHVSGGHNRAYALWTILMFESWRRRWMGKDRLSASANPSALAPAGRVKGPGAIRLIRGWF